MMSRQSIIIEVMRKGSVLGELCQYIFSRRIYKLILKSITVNRRGKINGCSSRKGGVFMNTFKEPSLLLTKILVASFVFVVCLVSCQAQTELKQDDLADREPDLVGELERQDLEDLDVQPTATDLTDKEPESEPTDEPGQQASEDLDVQLTATAEKADLTDKEPELEPTDEPVQQVLEDLGLVPTDGTEEDCCYHENWVDFTSLQVTYRGGEENEEWSNMFDFVNLPNEQSIQVFVNENTETTYRVLRMGRVGVAIHGLEETGVQPVSDCWDTLEGLLYLDWGGVKALHYLGRVAIEGEEAIIEPRTVAVKEDKPKTIIWLTPSDYFFIGGPWELTGVVERTEEEDIRFDLHRSFEQEGERIKVTINGLWSKREVVSPFEDDVPLSDWLVCVDDALIAQEGEGFELKTIGDMRALGE